MTNDWNGRLEAVYDRYLAALLAGNKTECIQIVSALLDEGIPIRILYLNLLQATMYQVGTLWEQGQISVAKEHLATSLTEFLLTLTYPRLFRVPRSGHKAVVACVASEYHQLGARMVADIFELNGWDAYFLGANTSASGLLSLVREKQPDLLCLSLSIYFNMPRLLEALQLVRETFPHLPILVGGQAFCWGGVDRVTRIPNVTYIDSIDHLERRLQQVSE
jgi:methanogenic corrinoid protein MtbC1